MPKYISKEKRLDIIFHKQNGETDKVISNKTPDITLNELIEKFDLKITEAGLSKYLKRIGLTYKKDNLSSRTRANRCSRKEKEVGRQTRAC